MYLLVHEDGSLQTVEYLTNDEFESCDAGILDIVDVSGDAPFQYYEGEWSKIEQAKQPET